jgi:hypothetical protein
MRAAGSGASGHLGARRAVAGLDQGLQLRRRAVLALTAAAAARSPSCRRCRAFAFLQSQVRLRLCVHARSSATVQLLRLSRTTRTVTVRPVDPDTACRPPVSLGPVSPHAPLSGHGPPAAGTRSGTLPMLQSILTRPAGRRSALDQLPSRAALLTRPASRRDALGHAAHASVDSDTACRPPGPDCARVCRLRCCCCSPGWDQTRTPSRWLPLRRASRPSHASPAGLPAAGSGGSGPESADSGVSTAHSAE